MKVVRWTAWIAVLLVAAATLYLLVSGQFRDELLGTRDGGGIASVGGPFTLVDTRGATATEKDFLGKPTAYFFGFTHCPDVCPTTLYEMTTWLAELGADADRLNVVFVSVDPARDTPDALAEYMSAFDERMIGLTGSQEQIDAIAKAFRVYVRKVEQDGGYTLDHTATVYLMDATGRFVGTIAYGESDEMALGKLKRLIGDG